MEFYGSSMQIEDGKNMVSTTRKENKNKGKLHFTTLNYAPSYALYPKLFERTLYTLNYHIYHTLHPDVTSTIMFNGMLLHMTSTCILFKWNKLKRLKHTSSKNKTQFFFTSLLISLVCGLFPKFRFL